MTEDILHQVRTTAVYPELEFNAKIHNEALISIEDLCLIMFGKMLHELGIPAPNGPIHDALNGKFERERQYLRDALSQLVQTKVGILNQQQKTVYDTLMIAVNSGYRGIFFLYTLDGICKTFIN